MINNLTDREIYYLTRIQSVYDGSLPLTVCGFSETISSLIDKQLASEVCIQGASEPEIYILLTDIGKELAYLCML